MDGCVCQGELLASIGSSLSNLGTSVDINFLLCSE